MTMFYEVQVERRGFGFCDSTNVASSSPEVAAASAEKIIAKRLYGDDWAKVAHEFFAYSVREMTAAEFIPTAA